MNEWMDESYFSKNYFSKNLLFFQKYFCLHTTYFLKKNQLHIKERFFKKSVICRFVFFFFLKICYFSQNASFKKCVNFKKMCVFFWRIHYFSKNTSIFIQFIFFIFQKMLFQKNLLLLKNTFFSKNHSLFNKWKSNWFFEKKFFEE